MRARARALSASHGRFEAQGLRSEGKGWPAPIVRGLAGEADAAPELAQLLEDADRAIRLKAAEVLFRLATEQEAAALPVVRVESIAEAVKFSLEDDKLVATTSVAPLQGEVRIVHPDLAGIVRMRVMDLQAIGDDSKGRNFSFVQANLTQPGTLVEYTHVHAIAGRLNLARDAESDEAHFQVELIQDPPDMPGTVPDPGTEPVRQRAEIDSEEQKRRPVAEHGETGEHRRVKLFIEQPVADHMLDVIRHHRQHRRHKIDAKIFVAQRREGDFFALTGCPFRLDIAGGLHRSPNF